jgi:hypothetical protein
MTAEVTHGSSQSGLDRPASSLAVRWLLWFFFVALGLLLLAAVGLGLFALRWWMEDRAAAAAVQEQVARLRAAGQPMTAEDLHRLHNLPAGTPDTTAAWLAAIKLATGGMTRNAKGIPYVGDGDAALLRPARVDSQLAAAEQFLADHDNVLQAILAAANQPGECRFPVAFEKGFTGMSAVLNEVQGVRAVVRLLALNMHVKAVHGQTDEAIESLAAMFAAADTLSHQLTVVEQEVRLAILSHALSQVERLLNEAELTDDQLGRIAKQLEACDPQGSFTRSLIGERAMGFQAFQQLGSIAPRSLDCQNHIQALTQTIACSSQPLPAGRQQLQSMIAQFQARQKAAPSWDQSKLILTNQFLPLLAKLFDAYVKTVAYRDSLLAAVAAERHRLKTGEFPAQLADLVPTQMSSVPLDPFDGQPLRFRRTGDDIVIYSVGVNGKDDSAGNPPGNSGEPDIVVRVSAVKAR